jgi:transcriptional regulator with XRE-family HTH domain
VPAAPLEAAVSAVVVPRNWDYTPLRTWREAAGLRRERVAADNEISTAWLYAIEGGTTGKRQVGVDTLIGLCRYYGHELSELIIPAGQVAERAQAAS